MFACQTASISSNKAIDKFHTVKLCTYKHFSCLTMRPVGSRKKRRGGKGAVYICTSKHHLTQSQSPPSMCSTTVSPSVVPGTGNKLPWKEQKLRPPTVDEHLRAMDQLHQVGSVFTYLKCACLRWSTSLFTSVDSWGFEGTNKSVPPHPEPFANLWCIWVCINPLNVTIQIKANQIR